MKAIVMAGLEPMRAKISFWRQMLSRECHARLERASMYRRAGPLLDGSPHSRGRQLRHENIPYDVPTRPKLAPAGLDPAIQIDDAFRVLFLALDGRLRGGHDSDLWAAADPVLYDALADL